MAEENDSLILEVLKRIQADIGSIKMRLDKLEARMETLERRQTAAMHFEQSVLAHLTGINESIDNLRADFIGVDRRVAALEKR